MSDKLQPCPFCGDVNPSTQGQTDRTLSYEPSAWIECETCGAQSRGFCRMSEAVEAWNRRAHLYAHPVTGQGDGWLRERLAEFDFCIQKVAEALGAVCGGVDGNQKDVHATTAVLLRHIEKLKSQAVTGQGDANGGWLPINSAPYNKTRVALIHSDGKGYVRYGVGWYMPLTGWQGWDGGDNYLQPTHWHPLPAAPMTAASGMDEGGG